MSKLYYTDTGRLPYIGQEELTRRRRARKTLRLPDTIHSGATLYLYAFARKGCAASLHVSVNSAEVRVAPDAFPYLHWLSLPLAKENLLPGNNTIILWSDNAAMDGWVLGIDGVSYTGDSSLSLDGGKTWQSERLGIYHFVRGEYIIRLRLHDVSLRDPPPPQMVWEQRDTPAFDAIRKLIPQEIQTIQDPWEKARALSTWVSTQWDYRNTGGGMEYTPWDPLTILSWGKSGHGQLRPGPIVMCVHYGIVFTTAALALGIPARNICSTNGINATSGHFVSEVWMEKWAKWSQVDANCDVVYMKAGVPLSVAELYPSREHLPDYVVRGPGFARQSVYVQQAAERWFISGESFRMWAVWPRNDYLSRPDLTPPSHGSSAYLETDWLWSRAEGVDELGMFPHHVEADLLQTPPPVAWRT